MTTEASLKGSSSLSNIMNPTYSSRDEIYDIRYGTCNVASDLVGSAVAVASESIPLLHMVLVDYKSVVSTPKVTMLDGGRIHIS